MKTLPITKSGIAAQSQTRLPAPGMHDVRQFLRDVFYPLLSDRRLTEQILFYRQMATLLKAGIPIYQALALREERAPQGRLKSILQESRACIERGGKFSTALSRHADVFPEFQIAMIQAGEEGGLLEETFGRIADYLESQQRLRRFINKHTTYSKIIFVFAKFAIPAIFSFIYGGSVLGVTLNFIQTLFWMAFFLCITFGVLRTLFRYSPEASFLYDQIKWSLPGIGGVARSFAFCRFGRALASLYAAGVPLQSALRTGGRASGNSLVMRAAYEMAGYVEHGVPLSTACRAITFFSVRTADMMATGAESGSIDTMMFKMAEYEEEEAEAKAHKVAFFVAQAIFLIVALYVTGLLQMIGGAITGLFFR